MNIVEYTRQRAINNIFEMSSFNNAWLIWKHEIDSLIGPSPTPEKILALGDHLSDIFKKTGSSGRGQSTLSSGGAAWEGLVCWYLNLCLIGTRSVVIKQNKQLIPSPLQDAFTVMYGGAHPSNTESDLVGITFPDKPDYTNKYTMISMCNNLALNIRNNQITNYKEVINCLCDKDFSDFESYIIQCKTNWNDNAQIPMLWDMIYASEGFLKGRNITVGRNNYNISSLKRFSYSFVTVPTNNDPFKSSSMSVKRVSSLSGGNYWGKPTEKGIASSLREFFVNCSNSMPNGNIRASLTTSLPELTTTYNYFKI